MKYNLKDIKTIFINPNETEKFIQRKAHTEYILLNILKQKDVSLWKTSINPQYCQELKKITADILESNLTDEPLLIVEDDINITHWYMTDKDIEIDIPDDSDALYLGNYRFGVDENTDGIYFAPPTEYHSQEISKIFNMLGAHAIIYKSKKYKEEIIKLFRDSNDLNNNDVILARNMKRFNIYTYKNPIFFQDQRFSNYSMQWCTYIDL
jgi:hypothetical protein